MKNWILLAVLGVAACGGGGEAPATRGFTEASAVVASAPVTSAPAALGDGSLAGAMLAGHNTVRANVSAGVDPASGLGGASAGGPQPTPARALAPMSWDAGLAAQAEAYAGQCVFAHDGARGDVGENLYVSSDLGALISASQVMGLWTREAADYDVTAARCRSGAMCGHYTQIVWEETSRVGCGAALCPGGVDGFGRPGQLWVCRYTPVGNYIGEAPYRPG